jgi:hypothetical protein
VKTPKILIFGLLLATVYLACSPSAALISSSASLTEKLSTIASNWGDMTSYDPHSDCFTYIPEVGVRARYQRARPELGLFIVESMVGKKAFLKGPHGRGMDCASEEAFGYYNPAFLRQLHSMVEMTVSNSAFASRFQPFYDEELRGYLRTFYLSYKIGTASKAIQMEYLSQLEDTNSGEDAGDYLQEAFRNHADTLEQRGYDWYEANTCASFWARRAVDGTADEFYALLETMMGTFDPGFEQM